jgi:hypothetical protein
MFLQTVVGSSNLKVLQHNISYKMHCNALTQDIDAKDEFSEDFFLLQKFERQRREAGLEVSGWRWHPTHLPYKGRCTRIGIN